MNQAISEFRRVLSLLAADADAQEDYLHRLQIATSLDELALEWDDVFTVVRPMLPEQAKASSDELDAALNAMSHGDRSLWSVSALRSRLEWRQVRELASATTELL